MRLNYCSLSDKKTLETKCHFDDKRYFKFLEFLGYLQHEITMPRTSEICIEKKFTQINPKFSQSIAWVLFKALPMIKSVLAKIRKSSAMLRGEVGRWSEKFQKCDWKGAVTSSDLLPPYYSNASLLFFVLLFLFSTSMHLYIS